MSTQVDGVDGLRRSVGRHLGHSEWQQVTQQQIDLFAGATGDHQWIHVDPERAAAGPFGATIAHGYLTLSLVPALMAEILSVGGVSMAINYGANRVRFPAPVRAGSRVRAGAQVSSVEEVAGGGVQAVITVTVEIEGADKPACVAETVTRFYA